MMVIHVKLNLITSEILAEQTQDFDPDTPELKGKCEKEK